MASNHTSSRPLHVLVPVDLHDQLKSMANARDRSVAAETRRAIERRVKEFKREQSEAAAA
jgi:predicted transcriptional regulator